MGRLYTGCKKGAQSKMSTKLKFPQHLLQLNVSMGSLGSSATSYPGYFTSTVLMLGLLVSLSQGIATPCRNAVGRKFSLPIAIFHFNKNLFCICANFQEIVSDLC